MRILLVGLLLFSPMAIAGEVINAGVGGNRTSHLLKRLETDVLSHNPSLVVVMVGTNDRLNSGGFVAIDDYLKNTVKLKRSIVESGAQLLLITPPPCLPELLFNRHDPKKFADQSPNERLAEVRSELLRLADEEEIPILDFHQYLIDNNLAGSDAKSVLRNPTNGGGKDGVHFTDAGYQLLAELIAEEIIKRGLNPAKVICLGDSLTMGPKNGKSYPTALAKLLK